ncbi:MAG: hypothetical protein AB2A00_09585 [Myxococcota bacterium]
MTTHLREGLLAMTEPAESTATAAPEEPKPSAPDHALHSPAAIGLAALIGTPLAGGLLLSANDEALGRSARGTRLLVACCLVSAGMAVMWMFFREQMPWMVVPPVSGALLYALAFLLHGTAYQEHVKAGGATRSWGAALGAGGMVLAMLGGGAHLFGTIVFSSASGNVMIKPQQLVYYDEGALRPDALKVGGFLARTPYPGDPAPFFNGDHPSDVKVLKPKGRWTVQFVLRQGAWEDAKTRAGYEQLAALMRDELFPGQPLDLHLTDAEWNARYRHTVK